MRLVALFINLIKFLSSWSSRSHAKLFCEKKEYLFLGRLTKEELIIINKIKDKKSINKQEKDSQGEMLNNLASFQGGDEDELTATEQQGEASDQTTGG